MPQPIKIVMENKPFDGHIHKLVRLYKNPADDRWCPLCGLTKNQIYYNEEDGNPNEKWKGDSE